MREIRNGHCLEEHFQLLFRHYFPSAVHFFVNRGLSKQDAEDLAQDVLFRVYKKVGTFRSDASFDTWLFRIMINVWKNALRSRDTLGGRAEMLLLDEVFDRGEGDRPGAVVEPQDPAEDPLDRVLADERSRLLLEAVDQLPPKMQQYVLLRVGQGLQYREIAEIMGVSITTVKSHLISAHQRLKPLLEKHFDVFGL